MDSFDLEGYFDGRHCVQMQADDSKKKQLLEKVLWELGFKKMPTLFPQDVNLFLSLYPDEKFFQWRTDPCGDIPVPYNTFFLTLLQSHTELLPNVKIDLQGCSQEERACVQKNLYSLGYRWKNPKKDATRTVGYPFMYAQNDGLLLCGWSESAFTRNTKYKQVYAGGKEDTPGNPEFFYAVHLKQTPAQMEIPFREEEMEKVMYKRIRNLSCTELQKGGFCPANVVKVLNEYPLATMSTEFNWTSRLESFFDQDFKGVNGLRWLHANGFIEPIFEPFSLEIRTAEEARAVQGAFECSEGLQYGAVARSYSNVKSRYMHLYHDHMKD